MRVALISDIHANEVALAAVLKDIRRTGADRIVCLGDVTTLGPHPVSTLQMVQALDDICILGNHDECMIAPEATNRLFQQPIIRDCVNWARDRLSGNDQTFIRSFRHTADISDTIRLFHGSPLTHTDNIVSFTPPGDLERMCGGKMKPVMAGGHTHLQMLRQHRGILFVNPGSVGLPFREFVTGQEPDLLPHAEYAVVDTGSEIRVSLNRVTYDRRAFLQSVKQAGGPVRRLLTPFLD